MGKRVSSHRIKSHRQYTYQEAAHAPGLTVQTVRAWRREGLTVLSGKTPHLIVGAQLKDFLNLRRPQSSKKLSLHEFRCLSCGEVVEAFGGMADYIRQTEAIGILKTLCSRCEGRCTKFVSNAQLMKITQILDVANSNE